MRAFLRLYRTAWGQLNCSIMAKTIIVEPKDVREIADQMIALMEDGEYYNRISEKAYNAVKDYTWEKLYSSKMVKLFDELLRK